MRKFPITMVLAVLGSGLLALGATACSDGAATDGPTVAGEGQRTAAASDRQRIPPVMVDLASLDGSTLEVALDNTIVVTGADPVTDWSGSAADPETVTFVPGRDDGSAQYNPGWQPQAEGTTTATMSQGTRTYAFTIVVTAPTGR